MQSLHNILTTPQWSQDNKGGILLLAVVSTKSNRNLQNRSTPENIHQQNMWSRPNELLGEAEGAATVFTTTPKRTIYYHLHMENLGRVPNTTIVEITHQQRGRLCYIKASPGTIQKIKSLIHHSFTYSGIRTLNCIPATIRKIRRMSPDAFKKHLDIWLEKISDQPPTPGYPSLNTNRLL